MTNPETFDGKLTTLFNTWWKSVTKYLSFYPETREQQKIAWVGTLLTDTARAWDLHRYDTLGESDTWANYAAAIRAEYEDTREAANAQLKLNQLRYAGDIRAYMTEFRALNNYAWATGEGLQEKVNLAMPDSVIDMQFAHYREEFVDDEGFLQATYQVALLVEKKKALKQAKEQMRTGAMGSTRTEEERKEEKRPEGRKQAEGAKSSETNQAPTTRSSPWGQQGRWATKEMALKRVPSQEHEEYFQSPESCWRCRQKGHHTYECFAHTTRHGTPLPKAPWKAAGVTTSEKQKRSEEPAEIPAPKQQKITAVDTMEVEPSWTLPIWANASDQLDF